MPDAAHRRRRAACSRRGSTAIRGSGSALLLAAARRAGSVVAYLGSLVVLFLNAFWSRDPFTSLVVREFTLDNFVELLTTRRLPDRHAPDGRRWPLLVTVDLHRPRLPDRLLHGPRRVAARPRHARRRGPHAALGELPHQGLLVAADPRPRTASSTGCSSRSGCSGPGLRRRGGLARLHRTCGCRT